MSEWRSMVSAPQDGSKFWGKCDDNAIAMFWHPQFNAFISSFRRMTMAQGYTIDGEPFKDHSPTIHQPENWMPITHTPQETTRD